MTLAWQAWLGEASLGSAQQGVERHGRPGEARTGGARLGPAGQARTGKAGQGRPRHGRHGAAGHGEVGHGMAGQAWTMSDFQKDLRRALALLPDGTPDAIILEAIAFTNEIIERLEIRLRDALERQNER